MTLPQTTPPAHGAAENAGPLLPLLTLSESHDLLRLLQVIAAEDDELAEEAHWFAQQLSSRIPPEPAG
ncbi:hypothetical protein [Streptomyces candidus]|uniref:Uncharacterized protein n=1 Tax=Streptomyces candidus TaxID=67283 RepID=A0A7X0HPC9_9ACTN|nr:hypothetical protein [Streptomyces candidus]MBB6440164.1 hypothetical protein [Streptomyces candidus]